MLPDDSSNEKNEQSLNYAMNDEVNMEQDLSRGRRDTDSQGGHAHNGNSATKVRKNRRDDKIPFTPEVSILAKSINVGTFVSKK